MMHISNLSIRELVRLGDRVFVNFDEQDPSWGYRTSEERSLQHKTGKAVSFSTYTSYVPRFDRCSPLMAPGVYEVQGDPIVQFDHGPQLKISPCDLSLCPESFTEKPGLQGLFDKYRELAAYNTSVHQERQAERAEKFGGPDGYELEQLSAMTWQRALPDLPFFELDTVTHSKYGQGTITTIQWHLYEKFCDDGVTPMPMYTVSFYEGGSRMALRADEIVLDVRGNVYWWYSDKSQVRFDSQEETLTFFQGLGLVYQCKNEHHDNFSPVNRIDAHHMIQEGKADVKVAHHTSGQYTLYKGKDEYVTRMLRMPRAF